MRTICLLMIAFFAIGTPESSKASEVLLKLTEQVFEDALTDIMVDKTEGFYSYDGGFQYDDGNILIIGKDNGEYRIFNISNSEHEKEYCWTKGIDGGDTYRDIRVTRVDFDQDGTEEYVVRYPNQTGPLVSANEYKVLDSQTLEVIPLFADKETKYAIGDRFTDEQIEDIHRDRAIAAQQDPEGSWEQWLKIDNEYAYDWFSVDTINENGQNFVCVTLCLPMEEGNIYRGSMSVYLTYDSQKKKFIVDRNASYSPLFAAYTYPAVPGDEEWEKMQTAEEKTEACQLPEDIMERLSWRQIVELVITYPLLQEAYEKDDMENGVKSVLNDFNGYREFLSRIEVRDNICRYIEDIDFDNTEEFTYGGRYWNLYFILKYGDMSDNLTLRHKWKLKEQLDRMEEVLIGLGYGDYVPEK